jgi:hypothetical protein
MLMLVIQDITVTIPLNVKKIVIALTFPLLNVVYQKILLITMLVSGE